jgi:uncharacterized protein (TIGR00251 family)
MKKPEPEAKARVLLDVKVVPGASKTEIMDTQEGRLRLRVAAAPEDGKANLELRSFLAKKVGCPKKDVQIVSGEQSRLKTLSFPTTCAPLVQALSEPKTKKQG